MRSTMPVTPSVASIAIRATPRRSEACVRLARSGRTVAVAPGQTILDALIAIGVEPPNSCRAGICGTCETRVLAGTPEHHDFVLSDAEKAKGDRMMICCSGSRTPELELDL